MDNVIFVNFKEKRKMFIDEPWSPLIGLLRTIHNAKVMTNSDAVDNALNLYLEIPRP